MLDRLWNGWRAQYVQRDSHGKHSDESVFTEILKSKLPDEETFIVHRGETCFVIMNAYPYSSGHVLVIPYREVPDLEYKPQGMNVGINLGHAAGGSVAQHLHIHIVPRWGGDSNFMVAVATAKILPEALDVTAQRIRNRWKEMQ
jgi:ATP adenylyltransferase